MKRASLLPPAPGQFPRQAVPSTLAGDSRCAGSLEGHRGGLKAWSPPGSGLGPSQLPATGREWLVCSQARCPRPLLSPVGRLGVDATAWPPWDFRSQSPWAFVQTHSRSREPAWTLWCARASRTATVWQGCSSIPQARRPGSGVLGLWGLGESRAGVYQSCPGEGRQHPSSFRALMVQTGEI